jgi:hypothetical protein
MSFDVKLDDTNENWLRTVRLERLRAEGWTGTLDEYIAELARRDAAGDKQDEEA